MAASQKVALITGADLATLRTLGWTLAFASAVHLLILVFEHLLTPSATLLDAVGTPRGFRSERGLSTPHRSAPRRQPSGERDGAPCRYCSRSP